MRRNSVEKISYTAAQGVTTETDLISPSSGVILSLRSLSIAGSGSPAVELYSGGVSFLKIESSTYYRFPPNAELPLGSGVTVSSDTSANVLLHYVGNSDRSARPNPNSSVAAGGNTTGASAGSGALTDEYLTDSGPVTNNEAAQDNYESTEVTTSTSVSPIPAAGANYLIVDRTLQASIDFEAQLLQQLSDSPVAWWKGDQNVSVDGTNVESWDDKIGGYSLTESNSARYPELLTSEQNGLDVLRFDGVNHGLKYEGIADQFGGNPHPISIVMLVRPQETPAGAWCGYWDAGSFIGQRGTMNVSPFQWRIVVSDGGGGLGYLSAVNGVVNEWALVIMRVNNGSNRSLQINEEEEELFSFFKDPGAPDTFSIGGVANTANVAAGAYWDPGRYDIAEVMVFNKDITEFDVVFLLSYFRAIWDVELT